ncbi:MAG TPA: hypothetical protein VGD05_04315 [Pyrinomonadaceae bacterium]
MIKYSIPSGTRKEMPSNGRKEITKGIAKQCTAHNQETVMPVLSRKLFELSV